MNWLDYISRTIISITQFVCQVDTKQKYYALSNTNSKKRESTGEKSTEEMLVEDEKTVKAKLN